MTLYPSAASEILDSPASSAVALAAILETTFTGEELYGAPEQEALDVTTIMMELEHRYNVELTSAVRNKINAILTLRTTEMFETDPNAFAAVTLAFCEGQLGDIISGVLEIPDHIDAVWTIFQAFIIDTEMTGLDPAVTLFVEQLAAQDSPGDAGDDSDDLLERVQDLQQELLKLGLSSGDVDRLIAIGMQTLQGTVQEQ